MYVCMYVCMYLFMYVCLYVCMYECMFACMYVYACMYIIMSSSIFIHLFLRVIYRFGCLQPKSKSYSPPLPVIFISLSILSLFGFSLSDHFFSLPFIFSSSSSFVFRLLSLFPSSYFLFCSLFILLLLYDCFIIFLTVTIGNQFASINRPTAGLSLYLFHTWLLSFFLSLFLSFFFSFFFLSHSHIGDKEKIFLIYLFI
jgi:hypothetical protein